MTVTEAYVMDPEGYWNKRFCRECEHRLVLGEYKPPVEVCNHPKSGGRYTTHQAREDVLRCGRAGNWFVDRAAMDRACK